jgi:proton glutamate symport protein
MAEEQILPMSFLNLLLNPFSVVIGMAAGIIIGVFFQGLVTYIAPLGEIYLAILKMSIIPIMVSAVIASLAKLLNSKETSKYLNKIVMISALFFLGTAVIGILAGTALNPLLRGDAGMKKNIGRLMVDKDEDESIGGEFEFKSVIKEIDSRFYPAEKKDSRQLPSFVLDLIPVNIFTALSEGKTLKIIFFSIVFGIMLKFISKKSSDILIKSFDGIFEAFQALIKFAMYFLPFGLCALVADQFSKVGFSAITSLLTLVILIYVSSLVILIISTLIIWRYCGGSYFKQFSALKDAIMIALGTRSSFTALPSAISGLVEGLELNKDRTKLTVSLGFTLCKYGKILIFCIGSIFAAYLYDYTLTIESYIVIIVGSILAGMAASGAPSIVSRSMISMVLAPLGIPAEAIIVVLLTIDPIVDPVITLISTYPNYAVTAVIANERTGIAADPDNARKYSKGKN